MPKFTVTIALITGASAEPYPDPPQMQVIWGGCVLHG
jgi:hypothetical protein